MIKKKYRRSHKICSFWSAGKDIRMIRWKKNPNENISWTSVFELLETEYCALKKQFDWKQNRKRDDMISFIFRPTDAFYM